jgi:peptide/nickel transport system substrate-binding protein
MSPRLSACTLRFLSILTLAIGLAACGPASDQPGDPSADNRVLRISQGSEARSMDPYFALESATFSVLSNIFESLTDISPDMDIVPLLAESWENLDPHTWVFRLRSGVTFQQGQPFDAEDVKYSIERALNWAPSRLRSEIPTVERVDIVDPHTVHIVTSVPDAILPTRLASLFILDRESSEAGIAQQGDDWLSTNPNGTGPYALERWVKDSECILVANEDYWNGAPAIKRLNFVATSNDATRIASFLNGNIDVLVNVPVGDVDRVRKTPGFTLISRPSLRLIYLGLDCGRDRTPGVPASPPNPLKDVRVRRAIYKAINVDLIVERVMNGLAAPAGQLFPEGVVGFDPGIVREPYDPDGARALLAEAGYPDGFAVRLDSPNDRYVNDQAIATAIAAQLARVGIKVEVQAMPKARFFPLEQAGDASFFLIGWANTNGDGNGTFDHLLHTMDPDKNLGGSNTSTRFSDPEIDRLSQAAASEFDPARREALLQEANRRAMAQLPHIPLHYQMDIYAVSDRVEWSPRRDTQVRGIDARWKN